MTKHGPNRMLLRCYGYRLKNGSYYGVCVDLNLAVQAESASVLRKKMRETISSYVESVLDTDDKKSINNLLCRRAPVVDRVKYYLIKAYVFIRKIPNRFIFFSELSPTPLPNNC